MSVIVFIFLSLLATCTSGLVLDLIPRNILYPPNSTLHQRTENIGKLPLSSSDGHVYYVKFTIGSKNIAVVASLDTGSHYLWIDCKKTTPVYDPKRSTSYNPLTCHSSYCKKVQKLSYEIPHGKECDADKRCKYYLRFADKSYSKGFMGFENITFKSPAPGSQYHQITNVLFGCGTETKNENDQENGVFGIGGKEFSVLKQTGNKLSYCLGDINHPESSSHLALGNDAKFHGDYVNFDLKDDIYYVLKLEKIVFGQKDKITMSPESVRVHTGSPATYLSRGIYDQLRSKVEFFFDGHRPKLHLDDGLCYALDPLNQFSKCDSDFHQFLSLQAHYPCIRYKGNVHQDT